MYKSNNMRGNSYPGLIIHEYDFFCGMLQLCLNFRETFGNIGGIICDLGQPKVYLVDFLAHQTVPLQ